MPKKFEIMQDQYPNKKEGRALNPKYAHLTSTLLAILSALIVLAYGTVYAQSLEQKYVYALAPLILPQSNIGSALQEAAFQQPDLLMVYGASELLFGDKPASLDYGKSRITIKGTPYGASQFFQYYPTGFALYDVAMGGIAELNIAQTLAAIGPELRGKKVVLSFTPDTYHKPEARDFSYSRTFSLFHANALIFNPYLSIKTRRIAAQRMNEYPDTLSNDPVLQFAVQRLSNERWYNRYLYYLSWPLGQMDTSVIRLQDHWEVLTYIWNHPDLNTQTIRKPEQIDWSKQIAEAEATKSIYANNNPYGIENELWNAYYSGVFSKSQKPGSADYWFLNNLRDSKEWTDLDLVLQVLQESGAQPLILSRPLNGPIWNAKGVSRWARKQYYVKLRNAVSSYGFPVVDFASHESDGYFTIDHWSHMSPEGWVYVDMTLDAFFHGQIH